jgi:hypothetical protein
MTWTSRVAIRSRLVLLAVACGLALALLPASAQAIGPITFGASLAQAPDVSFDCSVIPYAFPAAGGPSCSWGTPLFNLEDTGAGGLDVPATGTVYQVKLRVGAISGPMQLVVLRTLFNPNDLSDNQCCVAQAISSVFTPVVNGITTLDVDLPVGADSDPSASTDYLDQIGLSVLEDHVPIPLIHNGVGDGTYNEPAMTLGRSQLAGDPGGYMLDMQATWYPPGQSPATVVFPAQTVNVSGGAANVGVDCSLAPCSGTITITGAPATAGDVATGAKSKTVTYASGKFSLAAGKSSKVPAKLTGKGRTLARGHKRLKVTITVKLTNLSPAKTFKRTLQLRF